MDIKVVCFDIDGTLLEGNSWLFLTRGLEASEKKHLSLFSQLKMGRISLEKAEKSLVRMYRKNNSFFRRLMRVLFSFWIKRSLKKYKKKNLARKEVIREIFSKVEPKPEAKEVISYLKEKGYKVYLVSGAIDIYVKELARKLNVDGWYAISSLGFDKKGMLDRIFYYVDQGERKVKFLKEIKNELKIELEQIAFVGDGENDIESFKITKHGIVLETGNKELEEVAWKKIRSLKEIMDIL